MALSSNIPRRAVGNRLAPPRFLMFMVLLPVSYAVLHAAGVTRDWRDGLTLSFDVAAAAFMVSMAPIVRDSDIGSIRRHAADNDANRGSS